MFRASWFKEWGSTIGSGSFFPGAVRMPFCFCVQASGPRVRLQGLGFRGYSLEELQVKGSIFCVLSLSLSISYCHHYMLVSRGKCLRFARGRFVTLGKQVWLREVKGLGFRFCFAERVGGRGLYNTLNPNLNP